MWEARLGLVSDLFVSCSFPTHTHLRHHTHTHHFLSSLSLAMSFCILEIRPLKSLPWVSSQESTPSQWSQIYFISVSWSLQVLSWTWGCMPAKVKDELQKKYLYDSVVFQVMFFSKIFWYSRKDCSMGSLWGKTFGDLGWRFLKTLTGWASNSIVPAAVNLLSCVLGRVG